MDNKSNTNNINEKSNFQSIVNLYHNDLYRFGLWLTKNPDDTQDLVQETLLRAWKSFNTIKDIEKIKSWLYTIMRRENARRFEKKRPIINSNENENIEMIPQNNCDSDLSIEEFCTLIAIENIHPNYSYPLILKVIYGFSSKEIASIMGITPGAVMLRVYRAKIKLKAIINAEDKDDLSPVSH